MLAYLEFLQDRSTPEGTDLGDAEVRLRAAYQDVTRRRSAPETRLPEFSLAEKIRRPGRRAILGWVLGPAVAAVLLLLSIDTGLDILRRNSGSDQLRGRTVPHGVSKPATIELLEARASGEDELELRWRSVPGASSYEVLLFGGDLKDLARLGPMTDTTCVIRLSDLPGELPSDVVIGWKVVGYENGDAVAQSFVGTASFR